MDSVVILRFLALDLGEPDGENFSSQMALPQAQY